MLQPLLLFGFFGVIPTVDDANITSDAPDALESNSYANLRVGRAIEFLVHFVPFSGG